MAQGIVFDDGDVISGPIGDLLELGFRGIQVDYEAGMLVYASTMNGCYCDLCNVCWLDEDGQKVLELNAIRPSAILLPPDETPNQEACQIFQPVREEEYHHECPNHDVIVRWVQTRL